MKRIDGYACPACKTTVYHLAEEPNRSCWLVGNELYLICPNGQKGFVEEASASLRKALGLPDSAHIEVNFPEGASAFHVRELPSKTFSYRVLHGVVRGEHPVGFIEMTNRVNLAQKNHLCAMTGRKNSV